MGDEFQQPYRKSDQSAVPLIPSPILQPPSSIVVIGAGAAGLMAAIAAAGNRQARVVLLDSQEKIGAKILVSGGGRCNVTNVEMDASHFQGGSTEFVERVLKAYSLSDTLRFFQHLGVPLKVEQEMGKYFPVSDSAQTVLDALLAGARRAGVLIRCGRQVTGIERGNAWTVRTPTEDYEAGAVVLCTGGLALPKSGSTGAGYAMAGKLGHTIVHTTPALAPLLAECPAHAELSGVTLPVRLTWRRHRDVLGRYEGSFLFTHTGYSGPVALNISRHIARDAPDQSHATLHASFVPDVADGDERAFQDYLLREWGGTTAFGMVTQYVPRRVAEMICRVAEAPERVALARMASADRRRLLTAMLDQPLPVTGVDGYRKAEATAGGVCLDEVDPATMMSRLAPGLFLAGEVLDVDGELGGYNFQWAWSSGFVAGKAAAGFGCR